MVFLNVSPKVWLARPRPEFDKPEVKKRIAPIQNLAGTQAPVIHKFATIARANPSSCGACRRLVGRRRLRADEFRSYVDCDHADFFWETPYYLHVEQRRAAICQVLKFLDRVEIGDVP